MDSGMNSGTQSLLGEGILRDLLMSDRGPDRVPDVPLTVDKESSFNLSLNCTSDYVDTFQIDINSIKSVPKENQASELQELGVSVYDQETLEKGIIQQLDDAIEREKLEKVKKKYDLQIKSVQEDITAEEDVVLKIVQYYMPSARSLAEAYEQKVPEHPMTVETGLWTTTLLGCPDLHEE